MKVNMQNAGRALCLGAAVLGAQAVLATGIVLHTTCTPALPENNDPVIKVVTTQTSPPGGPVASYSSVTLGDVGPFGQSREGLYPHGLKVDMVTLQTPSGAYSSFFRFITVDPGETAAKELNEALYLCRTAASGD